MRSIRLSLVVYFLGLLCVSLAVASLLLYDAARRTLAAKQQAAEELVEARYEERARDARQHLDDRLLAQSKSLAGRVRPIYRWERIHNYYFHSAGAAALVGSLANRYPLSGALINFLQAHHDRPPPDLTKKGAARNRWAWTTAQQQQIWYRHILDLKLSKDLEWLDSANGSPSICWRIGSNGWGMPLTPEDQTVQLPYEGGFAPKARLTWAFDDYRDPNGKSYRRVRFRSLITLDSRPAWTPPKGSSWRPAVFVPELAAIIIQCAADERELDSHLADLAAQRDRDLEALRSDTENDLAEHRARLLWISGCTFGATALGSLALVWLGLSPLSRLSEAVSKVSPKNFSLDLDESRLAPELRPIAGRLSTTLDLLKRAFARQKQMTADVSHELRTPLAALLTTIDLALRKQRTPEQYREMLSDCRLSASQMHQIVERLLTLARLDAGVDRLRAQPVDVGELAGQCASVVRPLAEARGLSLEVHNLTAAIEEAAEGGPLLTDPDKLREVLTNLLHNAIQYNRPSGRIDVRVARLDGLVSLEVSDTGIGIAPEAREHIFERFYRADPSRNAEDLHAGLGLAIVKEYVELMGGRITVQSEEGQGSTFRVELPVCGPAQAG
jgi:signal transduction histidine kinase